MGVDCFIFNADIYCYDCGMDITESLILKGHAPAIRCNWCKFNDKVHPQSALKAFQNRDDAEWLKCPACGENNATFVDEDSCLFPQLALDGGGEADTVQYCGNHDKCVNSHNFAGRKCGRCLENPLTSEGEKHLIEMMSEPNPTAYQKALHRYWKSVYDYVDFPK